MESSVEDRRQNRRRNKRHGPLGAMDRRQAFRVAMNDGVGFVAFMSGTPLTMLDAVPNLPAKYATHFLCPEGPHAISAAVAVWMAPGTIMPVGTRADVFHSVDQGTSWHYSGSLSDESPTCIACLNSGLLGARVDVGVSVEMATAPLPREAVTDAPSTAGPPQTDGALAINSVGQQRTKNGILMDWSEMARLARALALDLFRFLESFDISLGAHGVSLIDRWFKKIEHRQQMDPTWWERMLEQT